MKILAIGNSFTHNATTYMPWLIERLDRDSICIAKLTRSGCSLKQHWTSHLEDSPDYDMYYSDAGKWIKEDITTIDQALTIMDWDIITIQQESSHSGIYSSYQPYLNNLIGLFHEFAPHAKTAWHSTWAYRSGSSHTNFYLYDSDPEKMYHAILDVTEKVGQLTDITIPATELMWRMRLAYPEVADGFSTDGYHISDPNALHALSILWYEILVRPYSSKSALSLKAFPEDVGADFIQSALSIIADMTGWSESDDTGVGMIYAD